MLKPGASRNQVGTSVHLLCSLLLLSLSDPTLSGHCISDASALLDSVPCSSTKPVSGTGVVLYGACGNCIVTS